MAYLLDTNVLSELRKGKRCDVNVRKWVSSAKADRHYVSVLSLGEIRKGIEDLRRKSPDQCPAFERWLRSLEVEYESELVSVTANIADRWGLLMAANPLPVIDGLIAATALELNLTVVTRNVADFNRVNVPIFNPFEPQP